MNCQRAVMRSSGNENQRHCGGAGSSTPPSGGSAIGRENNCRSDGDAGRLGKLGEALETRRARRRAGSAGGTAASGPHATARCASKSTAGEVAIGRPAGGWLFDQPVDLLACEGDDSAPLRRDLSRLPRVAIAAAVEVDTSEASSSSARTKRSCHRSLAHSRLAADKKRAPRGKLASCSSMKVVSCCSRWYGAPGL